MAWVVVPSQFFAQAHKIKLPDKACQPKSGSPERTSYSVWQSVVSSLDIVFCHIYIKVVS